MTGMTRRLPKKERRPNSNVCSKWASRFSFLPLKPCRIGESRWGDTFSSPTYAPLSKDKCPPHLHQFPLPTAPVVWMPASGLPVHGAIAANIGTVTLPLPSKPNKRLVSIGLTCLWNPFKRMKPSCASKKPCWCTSKGSFSSKPPRKGFTSSSNDVPRFWADVEPKIQARWALVVAAAEVLLSADRVAKAIKKAPTTIPELVKAYAQGDQPWCLLDTHHRHLESRKYNFEFTTDDDHQTLEKLITKAEQRYTEVGSELAKHFITQFAKAKHPIEGLLRQQNIFEKQVKPHLSEGKVAYVWVDALRFEMARELSRLLEDDFQIECQPALAMIPTITEIGMAALLPKAHESAKVVGVGGGKLGVEIAGQVMRNRNDRVAFLKQYAGVLVFDAKLEDLLPKPSKKIKDGIQNNQLILITSQEIDELGEGDNLAQARLQIEGVLGYLRRGVRILADHGIKTIVLVADHGHLFADEVGEDMKIEAPGGQVADLHRRVWVGRGGNSESTYLRTSLTSLGVESEYDIATPWTFAVFKSKGGGRAYFHGGLSPQELIVPVLVMHSRAQPKATTTSIRWTLTPGTPKLTTRFFSIQISGNQEQIDLFGLKPPTVRIEVRANKKCVSQPVSASYGFEDATGEVRLKLAEHDPRRIEPNTVTVMLSEEISQQTVGVYLLDAITGAELAPPLTLPVAISL
jgi:hypothetical protein